MCSLQLRTITNRPSVLKVVSKLLGGEREYKGSPVSDNGLLSVREGVSEPLAKFSVR